MRRKPTLLYCMSGGAKLDKFLHSICCDARVFVHRAINSPYPRLFLVTVHELIDLSIINYVNHVVLLSGFRVESHLELFRTLICRVAVSALRGAG